MQQQQQQQLPIKFSNAYVLDYDMVQECGRLNNKLVPTIKYLLTNQSESTIQAHTEIRSSLLRNKFKNDVVLLLVQDSACELELALGEKMPDWLKRQSLFETIKHQAQWIEFIQALRLLIAECSYEQHQQQ